MKGRVLVLTNFMAGLYSFRKEVMEAIVDNGYQLYISVPDTNDDHVHFFEGLGCHIIKTAFNRRGMNPFSDFRLMITYKRLIKKLKPVVVLTYTIKPNIYGGIACRLTRTPQIANVTGLGDAVENGGWLQKLSVILYRWGISKARTVFFQNSSNRDFFIRNGITNEESILLPGSGVNLSYHTYQDYPAEGTIRFLFIARLLKDKGTDEFFTTAETIKNKYPQTEFHILGWVEGSYEQQLEAFVKEGVVTFLGPTSDVRPYLKDAHCTIMPSYHEGLSNVNLESAANGRPIITTDVPGCKETVDDGVTGFLVKARDSQSLIHGVERFIRLSYDQKKQMGIEGRKKVEREYDRQIIVSMYLKAMNRIANV